MKTKSLIITHLILTIMAWTSWIWLDWRIIAVVAVAHLIMLEVNHGCPLTHAQMPGNQDARFYEWWMKKLGVKFTNKNRKLIFYFYRYALPAIIIGLAILFQLGLSVKPLIGFSH